MPGDFGDFSVNIGLGINFLAFVPQFVTLRDTLTYVDKLVVTVATLVRRQRQGCWDVYCTAAMGQVRPRRTIGYYHGSSTC